MKQISISMIVMALLIGSVGWAAPTKAPAGKPPQSVKAAVKKIAPAATKPHTPPPAAITPAASAPEKETTVESPPDIQEAAPQETTPEAPLNTLSPNQAGPSVEESPKGQALEAYNRGVELFKIAQMQANKGDTKAQERVLKQAIKKFEEALKHQPTLVEAQSNIGFSWLTLKKYNQAIAGFAEALKIKPKHLNTLNGLATAFAFNNQIDEASARFEQLTTLEPNNADYLFNYGAVLQKAGRLEDSEKIYLQALEVKANHQRSLFNLGTLKENQGKLEEALAYYNKAKGADIGNTIGLDAIKRIEGIQHDMNQNMPEPQTQSN